MKKIRSICALLLVNVLVLSSQGTSVLAEGRDIQSETQSLLESEHIGDEFETEIRKEQLEAENGEETDGREESTASETSLDGVEAKEKKDTLSSTLPEVDAVYVETMEVAVPGTQRVAIIFSEDVIIDSPQIRYQIGDSEEEYRMDLDKHAANVLSFCQEYTQDSQTGVYKLIGLSYKVDGEYHEVEFENVGTYCVGPAGSIAGNRNLINISKGTSIDDLINKSEKLLASVVEVGETFSASAISDALTNSKTIASQEDINLTDILSDIDAKAAQSRELVVVLDPSGCVQHKEGATIEGLNESELSLKIAEYVKAELETYDNIKVYLTRSNENCIDGTDYEDCLEGRVQYAKSVEADVFINLNVSLANKAIATGEDSIITIQNSNYFSTANIKDTILGELEKVGLDFTKLYIDLGKLENSTRQEYLSVVHSSISNGIPAFVLNHNYIDDLSSLQLLDSESELNAIGVKNATVIANYFRLLKGGLDAETDAETETSTETSKETERNIEADTSIETETSTESETSVADAIIGATAGFLSRSTVSTQNQMVQNFVTRLYKNIHNRTPDAEGLAYWTNVLINRRATGAEVAMKFINSPELHRRGLSDSQFVNVIYNTVLDRLGDSDGINYWNQILGYGISRNYMAGKFLTSDEFGLICEKYGIIQGGVYYAENRDRNVNFTRFVARLYEKAFNRKYDVDGLNYWTGKIADGSCTTEEVAEIFFLSPELRQKNYTNSEYVKVLYRTFLDREPDTEGYNYFLNRLNNGEDRITVMYSFSRGVEFKVLIGQIISEKINGRVMEAQYWTDIQVSDRTLMAAIIYTEARGETYAGQLGVGLVVMNRVNHANFPNNIKENIYWKNQFQPARTGILTAVLNDTSKITASCWKAADEAIARKNSSITLPSGKTQFDYLYFMTPASYSFNMWLGDDTFILGNHVFFSRIGYR